MFKCLPNIPVLVSNLLTPVSIGIMGSLCFFSKCNGESRRKNGKKRPSSSPSTVGPAFNKLPNPVKNPSLFSFVFYRVNKIKVNKYLCVFVIPV